MAALGGCAPAALAAHGIVVRHERVTIGGHASNVTTVSMPRPGGDRVLQPVLADGIVSAGTATTSSVSRRLARHGTAVAINADLFEYTTGQPSGLLVIDGEIYNQPQGGRPALAVDTDGTLSTSRPRASGSLRLPHGRELPFEVNVRTAPAGAVTYDRGWGPSAPAGAARSMVGRVTDVAVRQHDRRWNATARMRVLRARSGRLPIPADDSPDFLFQASGRAARLLATARPGREIGVRYRLGPLADDAWFAIGGGPILVRGGRLVYRREANREFADGQLLPPDARTAVAQMRSGRILFYVVDKGPGSAGFTVAEVARDLHRRGAVTAMAFDSGGSTSVSLDGRLLNAPSDGVERPVGNMLVYFVGRAGTTHPIGDVHVGRRPPGARVPALSYTLVRPAKVGVALYDPDGRVHVVANRRFGTGTHAIAVPAGVPLRPGRWRLAVDADGVEQHVLKTFVVAREPQAGPVSGDGSGTAAGAQGGAGSAASGGADGARAGAAGRAGGAEAGDRSGAGGGATAWIAGGLFAAALAAIAGAAALVRRQRARARR